MPVESAADRAVFFNAAEFVKDFMEALDNAGGNDIIDTISDSLILLGAVFSDPNVMRGIVELVIFLTKAFVGLVIAMASVIAFFTFLATAVEAFFTWLLGPASEAVAKFFTEDFPGWLSDLATTVGDWFEKIFFGFQVFWNDIVQGAKDIWNDFLDFWASIPDSIMDAVGNLGDLLYDAGKAILDGLWRGAKWAWDNTVGPFFNWVTQQIPDWKGPEDKDKKLLEPAGKAVMEGYGAGLREGAKDVRSMLGSFTDAIQFQGDVAANNTFNTSLNFMGQQPTTSQAQAAGRAVTGELDSQIAQRDMRLAVRMM